MDSSCCRVASVDRTGRSWSVLGVLIAVGIVTCVFAWAKYQFGSLSTARAFLRGQAVVLCPETIEIQRHGQSTEKVVVVQNNTLEKVVLLGARPTCDCLVLEAFPMTIPPLKSCEEVLAARVVVFLVMAVAGMSTAEGKAVAARATGRLVAARSNPR